MFIWGEFLSWLFGSKRRVAWLAVAAGLILTLTSLMPLLGLKDKEQAEFTFSVPGFDSAVDAVNYGKRWDILCGLDSTDKYYEDHHGFWQATKFQDDCNFRGSKHLFVGDEPRGLTTEQVLSAQDWYLDFLLNEYFDSRYLDSGEDLKAMAAEGNLPFLHPETLPKPLDGSPRTFEDDGEIVYLDNVILSGGTNGIFRALPHDGLPRILGLKLQAGALSVDFFGLESGQVKFSGDFSAFYRLDKSSLVDFVLESEPQWTLSSLKEAHPEYFNDSNLALRYDARVSHTLQKSKGSWLIRSWDSSGLSYDY